MGMITSLELTKRQAVIYVDGVAFLRLKRSDYDLLPLNVTRIPDNEGYDGTK